MTDTNKITEIMARGMYRTDFPHWQTPYEDHDTSYLGYKLAPVEIEAVADAAITALEQAGYQIVPVAATVPMIEAGMDLLEKGPSRTDFTPQFIRCYRAMLKAAKEKPND
jgi:hypothetical protein